MCNQLQEVFHCVPLCCSMLQYAVFMSIKALRFLQLVASLETSCNRCGDHCCANGNCKRCLATAPLHLFVGAGHQSETREKESVRAIDRESERKERKSLYCTVWRMQCRAQIPMREAPNPLSRCKTLQHTTTHCNTLQHTATHCNTKSQVL